MRDNIIGRPMEILLVEDSLMFARITMEALKKGRVRHRMTWLSDGRDAADFIFQRGRFRRVVRPDLVLLDLGLPHKDGLTILEEVRADEELKQIPIVVMTGSTSDEDRQTSENLGVAGYMSKPVDLSKFLAVVRELSQFWQKDMILPEPV
ncbi:MAG: response regulator [Planctomycetes bacterium]|nr:response regulator [Planctomycetota bacterium]